ncbi:MAG: glycosyltransferase family 2 protein [Kordiimonadaceae bacterium]|jgi:polyisoprenyl-phosphate glycosyltransferase|nr:glycosyltransferase family 2 protein [Kordiimonadaceae bacterium]
MTQTTKHNPDSKLVSIVVPFHNESENVDIFYTTLVESLQRVKDIQFEIICIDDGSTDDTLKKLIAHASHDERIHIIELSRNFGKESALTAGIDHAQGRAVIPIDADLQDPPDVVPALIEKWLQGAEVVLAHRMDRSSDTLAKRKTAEWFYRFHNKVSQVHIPENVGDFRLIDRIVVEALKQLPEKQRFMKGLFAWVGFKTESIEYVRLPREASNTKFSGWKLWNFALEGITSFSTAPLKVWTYIGAIGALVTFAYASFIILDTIISGVDVPGYASLLVVILFFGSLQLMSVGLLGEYIGRIYLETKQRPTYIVRQYHGKESGS